MTHLLAALLNKARAFIRGVLEYLIVGPLFNGSMSTISGVPLRGIPLEDLPDEIMLRIFSFLGSHDLAPIRSTSRQFYRVSMDNNLWRLKCFEDSRAELARRQVELLARQEPRLAALRTAMTGTTIPNPTIDMVDDETTGRARNPSGSSTQEDDNVSHALAAWDPSYPGEKVDFYQEYVQRHAPIVISWAETASRPDSGICQDLESLGIAVLHEYGLASKLVSPMDDGSVCIWDISQRSAQLQNLGKIVGRTSPGCLEEHGVAKHASLSQETEAIENISIDSYTQKAYIAVYDSLVELDIETLKVVSRKNFPFPITCLSEAKSPIPLTVGTNHTLNLYDNREGRRVFDQNGEVSVRCEQIGGTGSLHWTPYHDGFATPSALPEPGPLSILHLQPRSSAGWDINGEIWVAGRFTSLLVYDRRMWPQISRTIFSGARLSCISSMPYPFIPRPSSTFFGSDEHLSERSIHLAKTQPGVTVFAAGQYKGKGSLELYGLKPAADSESSLTCTRPRDMYRNRQTASKSRLLYVAPHGARLVHSDADGNLKWVERDGKTLVRTFNINSEYEDSPSSQSGPVGSLFSSVGSLFARDIEERGHNDLVQKIIPVSFAPLPNSPAGASENLLIQTGDGRIGMVEFGRTSSSFFSANEANSTSIGSGAQEDSERGAEEERTYSRRMREAIESQANHARLLRRLDPSSSSMRGY